MLRILGARERVAHRVRNARNNMRRIRKEREGNKEHTPGIRIELGARRFDRQSSFSHTARPHEGDESRVGRFQQRDDLGELLFASDERGGLQRQVVSRWTR